MIQQCLIAVSYSILLNASKFEKFMPTKGLRQRDLLSPYLFILVAETPSRMLVKAEQ